ncbi:MAG TPA: hypothetical protein VEA99_12480, partial [Gemmatimonadaceae bacterium]|nr:hypothetical protein [Gemmatimonadaceae bacterium]
MRADPFIQGYGGIFPRRRRGFSLPLRTSLVGSDGRVATFARASKAWYEDSTGLIREVAAGVPRQRADLGTLIEEARTNYAIYSDAPTAGPWFFGADATAGYGLDGPSPVPAGRATRVVFAGSGGNRIVRSVLPEGTLTAGATYTYSIWLWAPVPIETRLFRNNQSSWSTAARGGAITVGPVPRRVSLTFAQAAGETKAYCGFG